jgi:hypothetical protein
VVARQADLLEVIHRLDAVGGFANSLYGRHQQCHEDSDDRDDCQELDQGEAVHAGLMAKGHGRSSKRRIGTHHKAALLSIATGAGARFPRAGALRRAGT